MDFDNFHIDGKHGIYYTPEIDFNKDTGICTISGESYLEDSSEFYRPVVQWVLDYFEIVKKPMTFNFDLDYYNTSSSRYIVEIISILKKNADKGIDVTINWFCSADEDDYSEAEEEIEDFTIETGAKINLVKK